MTPHHFSQSNSVRYDTPPLLSSVRTAAIVGFSACPSPSARQQDGVQSWHPCHAPQPADVCSDPCAGAPARVRVCVSCATVRLCLCCRGAHRVCVGARARHPVCRPKHWPKHWQSTNPRVVGQCSSGKHRPPTCLYRSLGRPGIGPGQNGGCLVHNVPVHVSVLTGAWGLLSIRPASSFPGCASLGVPDATHVPLACSPQRRR